MAEYLTPGVYIEAFESGVKAIEGIGTSTAWFVGMASRGQTIGKPRLITSVAEFRKYFGDYLGEKIWWTSFFKLCSWSILCEWWK